MERLIIWIQPASGLRWTVAGRWTDAVAQQFTDWTSRRCRFGESFSKWLTLLTANPDCPIDYVGWLPEPITVESAVPHGCPFSPLTFILICIIETFLLSQFVYVMQALIAPPDFLIQVNTLLFRFLSKNKNSKAFEKAEVKRVVMCSSYEEGGLNMINVVNRQKSFVFIAWHWQRNQCSRAMKSGRRSHNISSPN